MDSIVRRLFSQISYIDNQLHAFVGNCVWSTGCGSGGTSVCLLSWLPLLSVAREVSDLGLTYISPTTLPIIIGPVMAIQTPFLGFNVQMLEGITAHSFEFTKLC